MIAAQIADLSGTYGTIRHELIASKIRHYGITRIYGSTMVFRTDKYVPDVQAIAPDTLKYMNETLHVEYGIARAPNWTPGIDEAGYALAIEKDLLAIGIPKAGSANASKSCPVLANAEDHAFDMIAFLDAYRKLRPSRDTDWAIEGFQGGRLSPAIVQRILHDPNLRVFGEAYLGGAMLPAAGDAVRVNLEAAGLPRARVGVVYDARQGVPAGAEFVYTFERLP